MSDATNPYPTAGAPTASYTYRPDGQTATEVRLVGDGIVGGGTSDTVTTSYAYDGAGRLQAVTEPGGAVTTYTYGKLGRVSKIAAPDVTTHFCYDADGNQTDRIVDPASAIDCGSIPSGVQRWHTDFDDVGRPVAETNPEGEVTTTAYDAAGRVSSVTEADGSGTERTTTYGYDGFGRLVTTAQPRGAGGFWVGPVERRTYTPGGRVDAVCVPDDDIYQSSLGTGLDGTCDGSGERFTDYTYNAGGQLTEVTAPTGDVTVYTYDAAGRVDEVEVGANAPTAAITTSYAYDLAGRRTRVSRPSSNGYDVTQLSVYDPAGRVTFRSEFAQNPIQGSTPGAGFTYNAAGWLLASTDPLGNSVTYEYDPRGNRRTRTSTPDGSTPVTEEWSYDGGDRVTSHDDQADATTTYTWGATTGAAYGRLGSVADPSGRTRSYTYDLAGRVTGETNTASGLDTVAQTFAYDDLGRRTSATRQVGAGGVESQSFSFDLAGNLLVQDGPEADAGEGYDPDRVTHSWSVTGTPREMTYPNGAVLRWDHDDADRVRFTYLISGGVTLPIGEYSYYSAGQLRKEHFDGGQIAERWYHYQNNSAELTYYEQDFDTPNDDADIDTDLVYDDAGRLVSECDLDNPAGSNKNTVCTGGSGGNGSMVAYGYDDAGQLTDVTHDGTLVDEVAYDDIGNRATYTRYDSSGDRETLDTYSFDGAGALDAIDRQPWTGSAWGTAADLVDYTFDAAGRRTQTDPAGGETWDYTWDAQGRLVGRDSTDNAEDETYGYDPAGNRTARTTGAGTGTMVWDNAEAVSRLITQTGSGATFNWGYGIRPLYLSGWGVWLSHDHHGSVVDYYNLGMPEDYDPWGNPAGGNAAILNSTLPFYRSEFGMGSLVHLRNRDYDPTTGSFLTKDPLDGVDGTTTVANP